MIDYIKLNCLFEIEIHNEAYLTFVYTHTHLQQWPHGGNTTLTCNLCQAHSLCVYPCQSVINPWLSSTAKTIQLA